MTAENPRRRRLLFGAQRGRCHYCDRQMTMEPCRDLTCTVDHKIPASRGGTRDPSNIVGACWQCNTGRGDIGYGKFKAVAKDMLAAGQLPTHGPGLADAKLAHERSVAKERKRAAGRAITEWPKSLVYQHGEKTAATVVIEALFGEARSSTG